MALSKERTDPAYIVGRIVAICEVVVPLNEVNIGKALKHSLAFVQIVTASVFSLERIDHPRRDALNNLIGEIITLLPPDDPHLTGERHAYEREQFLAAQTGFRHQRIELRNLGYQPALADPAD